MYEAAMSDLVVKICKDYATSLGLDFPPCAQQEINAICEWVNNNTVTDLNVDYKDGLITFTFKVGDNLTKYTIPVVEYVTITPASATSGTLTSNQLETLQKNGNNLLVKNNRYYRQTQTYGAIMYYTATDNGVIYQIAINTDSLTWEFSKKAVVDTGTSQEISGIKTFSNYIRTPQVAGTDEKALVRQKQAEKKSVFGNDSTGAVIMGNGDRPYYSKSGSDFVGAAIALLSDISGGGTTGDLTEFNYYDSLADVEVPPGIYVIQAYDNLTSKNLVPFTVTGNGGTTIITNVYNAFVFVTKSKASDPPIGSYEQFCVAQTMTSSTTLYDYFRTCAGSTSLQKFTIQFTLTSSSNKFVLRKIAVG